MWHLSSCITFKIGIRNALPELQHGLRVNKQGSTPIVLLRKICGPLRRPLSYLSMQQVFPPCPIATPLSPLTCPNSAHANFTAYSWCQHSFPTERDNHQPSLYSLKSASPLQPPLPLNWPPSGMPHRSQNCAIPSNRETFSFPLPCLVLACFLDPLVYL